MTITTGQATREQVEEMEIPWREINWVVMVNGAVAAIFQAEDDGDGCLAVHATVKRRTLHPKLTHAYAHLFSSDLLRLGARQLKAEISIKNRAAIRIARAAGFAEISRNDEWVTLERER